MWNTFFGLGREIRMIIFAAISRSICSRFPRVFLSNSQIEFFRGIPKVKIVDNFNIVKHQICLLNDSLRIIFNFWVEYIQYKKNRGSKITNLIFESSWLRNVKLIITTSLSAILPFCVNKHGGCCETGSDWKINMVLCMLSF